MKKFIIFGCLFFTTVMASAESANNNDGKVINVDSIMELVQKNSNFHRISPKYLSNYYTTGLANNWFVGIQGGLTAFVGNPAGCGDLFDRINPTYGLYVGKWHNPFVGTRVMYQNGKIKDATMEKHSFQAYHADLLYNVTKHLLGEDQSYRNWDVIPYLGLGFANGSTLYHDNCNCDACNGNNRSFLIAYGVQGRYRLTPRLLLTAEFGGLRTMSDFDNYGSRHGFKDNLFNLSVGVTYNIGKSDFKHPIDAKPYIAQNDYLLNSYGLMSDATHALYNQHLMDESTLDKLRQILIDEGLWDEYKYLFDDHARNKRNYYKGLLSLRSRLMEAQRPKVITRAKTRFEGKDSLLNAPVYFFFKLGNVKLTDRSQLVNLDEIARIAKKYNLVLRIDGAADKETGSISTNNRLSHKRCVYICQQLKKRGIDKDHIRAYWHGGVNQHDRNEEDRNTKVTIYTE